MRLILISAWLVPSIENALYLMRIFDAIVPMTVSQRLSVLSIIIRLPKAGLSRFEWYFGVDEARPKYRVLLSYNQVSK